MVMNKSLKIVLTPKIENPRKYCFTHSGRREGRLETAFSEILIVMAGFPGKFFVIVGLPEVLKIPGSEYFLINSATIDYLTL